MGYESEGLVCCLDRAPGELDIIDLDSRAERCPNDPGGNCRAPLPTEFTDTSNQLTSISTSVTHCRSGGYGEIHEIEAFAMEPKSSPNCPENYPSPRWAVITLLKSNTRDENPEKLLNCILEIKLIAFLDVSNNYYLGDTCLGSVWSVSPSATSSRMERMWDNVMDFPCLEDH